MSYPRHVQVLAKGTLAFIICIVTPLFGEGAQRDTWPLETMSPRPYAATRHPVWALCPEPDQALTRAARELAAGTVKVSQLAGALHEAGDPHVAPRSLVLEAARLDAREIRDRLVPWMSTLPKDGRRRCGFAGFTLQRSVRFAAVVVDALADLAPVPTRVAPASWVNFDAQVHVAASHAKVVLQNPNGEVASVLTSWHDGRARARANLDRAGRWVFQLLIEDETGPRPALEAAVFVGIPPLSEYARPESTAGSAGMPSRPTPHPLATEGDQKQRIRELVSSVRRSRGVRLLSPDSRLDAVAEAHARAMQRASKLGHDVGDGDPQDRLHAANVELRAYGENVAHAATVELAHDALWSSPSHRANLQNPAFDRLGVGVVADADGTVWVTQLFGQGG